MKRDDDVYEAVIKVKVALGATVVPTIHPRCIRRKTTRVLLSLVRFRSDVRRDIGWRARHVSRILDG